MTDPTPMPPQVSDPPEQTVWASGLLLGTLISHGVPAAPIVDVTDEGDNVTSRISVRVTPELLITIEVLGATNG